jgi:hypothetical protein
MMAEQMGDAVACLHYARHAALCPAESQTHASTPACYGPEPAMIAARAAGRLSLHAEALDHARKALERAPDHPEARAMVAELEPLSTEPGPKAA